MLNIRQLIQRGSGIPPSSEVNTPCFVPIAVLILLPILLSIKLLPFRWQFFSMGKTPAIHQS